MTVLDENIIAGQRNQLRQWRMPFRQIGFELASQGAEDPQIIPLLLRLKQPTFFTRDFDFFKPQSCHPRYCLAWLNVRPDQAAFFIRRFLRHPAFSTRRQRMGAVVRIHTGGVAYWHHRRRERLQVDWAD